MGNGAGTLATPKGDQIYQVGPANEDGSAGPVYRAVGVEELVETYDENVRTQWDLITDSCEKFKDRPFLGKRMIDSDGNPGDFEWTTYGQVLERAKTFACGLAKLDLLKPDKEGTLKLIGLAGVNCAEWIQAEWGAFALGGTTIPFYTSYGVSEYAYGINLAGLATVCCPMSIAEIMIEVKKQCPSLQYIICYDSVDEKACKRFQENGLELLGFNDVLDAGRENPLETFPGCEPDQIYSFVWTSGSTGNPKAVMLKHKGFVANVTAMRLSNAANPHTSLKSTDVYLSYLPIGHVMERTILSILATVGARVGMFRGTREAIFEDIAALRPTQFMSVPRLLNKLVDKIHLGFKAKGKEKILEKALAAKFHNLKTKGKLTHVLWDRLLFKKIQKKLGLDRVRSIGSGSAPFDEYRRLFLSVVFCCPVTEGYGMSELTCAATGTLPNDLTVGHVGRPMPWAEIRLASVPDLGYKWDDSKHGAEGMPCRGRGEICVRGTCAFTGYYGNEEATKETIDEEGFVHTGDIGLWTMQGNLKIIDRKKNIFKLSQGEYVAPEKIEGVLSRNASVAQIFIHGDSLQSCLVAVVVPDVEVVVPWAISKGLLPQNTKESDPEAVKKICESKEVCAYMFSEIKAEAKRGGLASFEVPFGIYLESIPFDPSNQILTSTFKLRRKVAEQVYQDHIVKMYAALAAKERSTVFLPPGENKAVYL